MLGGNLLTLASQGGGTGPDSLVPQVDISLTKRTQITEKTSMQFRAEAFNATNTYSMYIQQFTNDPNSALFGT